MKFREAVELITGIRQPVIIQTQRETEKPKTLILPEKAGVQLNIYDYLCRKRGIDKDVVNTLIQEKKLYEDRRGNVVFVGYDEHNKPRFASIRGTYGDCGFRMDCTGSDKRYGFNMTYSQSERLYIFESAIDCMSHASLDKSAWKRYNRLSLSGTSDTALSKYLELHPYTKELILCLDNDTAGRESSEVIAKKYTGKGYYTQIELPAGKDFNDDLTAYRTAVHNDKLRGEFNDR